MWGGVGRKDKNKMVCLVATESVLLRHSNRVFHTVCHFTGRRGDVFLTMYQYMMCHNSHVLRLDSVLTTTLSLTAYRANKPLWHNAIQQICTRDCRLYSFKWRPWQRMPQRAWHTKSCLQRARRYGMQRKHAKMKYTYGGVVFIYNPRTKAAVTSWTVQASLETHKCTDACKYLGLSPK